MIHDPVHFGDVGIIGVGIDKGMGAFCHLCDYRLHKGSVRFKYVFHKNRPAKWIHRGCVALVPDHMRPFSCRNLRKSLHDLNPPLPAKPPEQQAEQIDAVTEALSVFEPSSSSSA